MLYGYADLEQVNTTNYSFGIIISPNEKPAESNGVVWECTEVDRNNRFFAEVKNLTPGVVYYYKAFIKLGDILRVGEIKSFSTEDVTANISTMEASEIGLFQGTLNGKLTVIENEELEKLIWFYYIQGEGAGERWPLESLVYDGVREENVYFTEDGNFSVTLCDLSSNTYYYVACAKVAGKEFVGEIQSFKTDAESDYGQAIDIGLRVKWRNCNLGATAPEEYGDYYAWGEKWTKDNYSDASYRFRYDPDELSLDDDVAYFKLGEGWRMPKGFEINELVETKNNSDYLWEWVNINTIVGWKVTYLVNNNSVFFPAAGRYLGSSRGNSGNGFYWSSTRQNGFNALSFNFCSSRLYYDGCGRLYGCSVRPVYE